MHSSKTVIRQPKVCEGCITKYAPNSNGQRFCTCECRNKFCKQHDHIVNLKWKRRNRDKMRPIEQAEYVRNRDRYTTYSVNYNAECKNKFLQMYGSVCACTGCTESNPKFLTIEHIKGKNKKKGDRSGPYEYRKAVKRYRPDLYETLCIACNWGKGMYKQCPHLD